MKKASGRLLFLVAYFAYASIYIARLNLTVASPVMQSEKLMNAAQIGTMAGLFFLFSSAGQPLTGYLGDIFPPKIMIMTGLFLTAASNLGIGFLPGTAVITLLWGINGFAQSMLWGPLLRTVASHYPPGRKSFIASLLVSSVGTGSIIGVFLATAAIYFGNLRYAFIWPGAAALLSFIAVFYLFPGVPAQAADQEKKPLASLFSPGLILLLLSAMCHGVLKDNITLWAASYFMDTFSVDLPTMSFFVFAVPLLTLAGRLIYPLIYRACGGNEHRVSLFALILAAVSLVPLCYSGISLITSAICLSTASAAVSLINTSFLTIYPMRYQQYGCVSKVVGLMDFATYLGAGISSSFYGFWLESHTYSGMFLSWVFLSVLAVILLFIVQKRRLT